MTRVLIFFAAFIGAIAVPQIIAHGLNYLYPAQSGFGEDENALRATPAGFADPALVFGRSVRDFGDWANRPCVEERVRVFAFEGPHCAWPEYCDGPCGLPKNLFYNDPSFSGGERLGPTLEAPTRTGTGPHLPLDPLRSV